MWKRRLACLGLLLLTALPAAAQETLVGIEPYEGSEEDVSRRVSESFGRTERITGLAEGRVLSEPFEGRILLSRYRNPPDRSTLEIAANYLETLQARGFEVDWACSTRQACGNQADGGWNRRTGINLGIGGDVEYFTGQMPHDTGVVYVSVAVERANHWVQVLQGAAMDSGQVRVLDAAAMSGLLDSQGRLTVDNILFDFGKADLLPDSDAAISEIARLLTDRGDIGLYVVGHTDSVGGFDANLALSRARAEAVVTALEQGHGIAPGRAVPAGVGPLAPVASNATEEGRALNRRVEIVLR